MARNGDGALLLGRRSYEHLLGYWNTQPDSPFTPVLNNMPKYVRDDHVDRAVAVAELDAARR